MKVSEVPKDGVFVHEGKKYIVKYQAIGHKSHADVTIVVTDHIKGEHYENIKEDYFWHDDGDPEVEYVGQGQIRIVVETIKMDSWAYEYFKAFGAKNITVLSVLYAEDIVLIEHPGGKKFEGKETVLAENQRLFDALPDLQIRVLNQGTESNGDGPSVFNHIEVFDGNKWIPVVDIITYCAGQIAKIEAFVG